MLTTKQLEERQLGIGGSDVAAICGISKYKTPLDVFLEKIGEREAPQLDNPYIHWGNIMEPVIANEFESYMTKLDLWEGKSLKEAPDAFIHPDYPFMRANVDRLIEGEDALLEIKTASSFMKNHWGDHKDASDEMPTEYLLQVAHYCMVLNKSKAYVAVLIGGNDFRVVEYHRNHELEKKLIAIETKFWNEHVLKFVPPSAQTIEDIGFLVKEIKRDGHITANEVLESDWASMKRISEDIKVLQRKYEDHKLNICLAMNDNEILMDAVNGKMATWKKQTINRFDIAKFQEENPELHQRYLKQTESRVFRIY